MNTDVSKGLSKANKLLGVNSVVLPPNDTPWYLEADVNEDEIVMVEGKADGSEREVKGGSIEALVTRLTLHKSEYSGAPRAPVPFSRLAPALTGPCSWPPSQPTRSARASS